MKTFFLLLAVLIVTAYLGLSTAVADGPLTHVVVPSFTAGAGTSTNTTQTLTIAISGKLREICLDLGGTASPTVAVTVATTTGGTIPIAQEIFSDTISVDTRRAVKQWVYTYSGTAQTGTNMAPIYLQHDYIQVIADSTKTGISVRAWLIFDN